MGLILSLSLSLSGIQTSQDAKFYAASASFDKFSNADKTLVVQFTVKHEQKIDCGGGYVKVRRERGRGRRVHVHKEEGGREYMYSFLGERDWGCVYMCQISVIILDIW